MKADVDAAFDKAGFGEQDSDGKATGLNGGGKREPGSLALSDEVLAQNFIDEHINAVRYTALRAKWQIWDGCRWATDERLVAFSRVRKFCHARARLDA